MLLLESASAYLLNRASPKIYFPCTQLYYAADIFVNELHVLFSGNRAFNNSLFLENGLKGYLGAVLPLSRTIKPTVVQTFLKSMKLFYYDCGDRQQSTEQNALNRLRHSIRRIRNVFPASDTAVPLQPAASDVAADATPRQLNLKEMDVAEAPASPD